MFLIPRRFNFIIFLIVDKRRSNTKSKPLRNICTKSTVIYQKCLILLSISVHILILKCLQIFINLVQCCRHIFSDRIQPVLTNLKCKYEIGRVSFIRASFIICQPVALSVFQRNMFEIELSGVRIDKIGISSIRIGFPDIADRLQLSLFNQV